MKILEVAVACFIILLSGCLTIGRKVEANPADVFRRVEAQTGHWCILSNPTNHLAQGIAVRVNTDDLIVFHQNEFRLLSNKKGEDVALESSKVLEDMKEVVFRRKYRTLEGNPLPSRLFAHQLKVTKCDGKVVDVLGAWLNVDRIFNEREWCNFLIVDDLSQGYLFMRNEHEVNGCTPRKYGKILDLSIKETVRNYEELK